MPTPPPWCQRRSKKRARTTGAGDPVGGACAGQRGVCRELWSADVSPLVFGALVDWLGDYQYGWL
jgi:hypothetical protein